MALRYRPVICLQLLKVSMNPQRHEIPKSMMT